MADINNKIKLEGEKEYRDALQQIVAQSKLLDSEMKKAVSTFDSNTSAQEKAAKQSEVYSKQLENQQKKIDLISDQLEKATAAYGENDTYVMKLQTDLNKAQTAFNETTNKVSELSNEMNESSHEIDNAGDAMEESGEKALSLGDVIKANLISEAIISGVKALGSAFKDVAVGLKDMVMDSANMADDLVTQSTITGLSTDALQEYAYMANLADTSVETITGSLTKLEKNMYSAKDGTGSTADAFKKLGINVKNSDGSLKDSQEVFNDILTTLGGMENETERDALAMTLLGKSAKDLNPLIALGAEGFEALRQEAHDVGYVLDEDTLSSMLEVSDSTERVSKAFDALKNNLAAQFMPGVAAAMGSLVEIIRGSMSAFQEGGFDGLIEYISQILDNLLTTIQEKGPGMIEQGMQLLQNLLSGITAQLPSIASTAVMIIGELAGNILSNLPQIIATGLQIIMSIIQGIVEAVPDLIAKVPEIISNMVESFEAALPDIEAVGENIVKGLWEGISRLGSWLGEKVSGFFGDIVDGAKKMLKISSPSKVFAEIGAFSAEGYAEGFTDQIRAVNNAIGKSIMPTMDSLQIAGTAGGLAVAGASNTNVNVILQGDAAKVFKLVRTENNKFTRQTGRSGF